MPCQNSFASFGSISGLHGAYLNTDVLSKSKKQRNKNMSIHVVRTFLLCFALGWCLTICSGLVSSSSSSNQNGLKEMVSAMSKLEQSQFGNKYKDLILKQFFKLSAICHERFVRCSTILSPGFCISSAKNFSFYLWARKIADNILDEPGVNCPRSIMVQFYKKITNRN